MGSEVTQLKDNNSETQERAADKATLTEEAIRNGYRLAMICERSKFFYVLDPLYQPKFKIQWQGEE